MAIFTSAAVAAFLAIEASFFTTAVAFVLNAAVVSLATIGVSYAAKAVAGHQNQPAGATDSFGVQGKLAGGGEVPRSFNVGYIATAGSLVYGNTHGGDTATPNAYITQVIALADLPSGPLREFWCNGQKCTLPDGGLVGGAQGDDAGYAVPEFIKARDPNHPDVTSPHLYLKYYDGTQTVADPYLVGTVASDDRPYQNTRVGVGVAYAIATAQVNEAVWNGFPTFKFVNSVLLYDPSKDDSVGGAGDQRYDDHTTWGGDGDDFPAVQTYNALRGFSYNGIWLYGLQNTSAARLPVANWITQIAKCRTPIDGEDGPEPTYRSGLQINVNTQPANTIQALLTACQGKVSSIGGFYKLRLGAPDSPTFSFTDGDIVSIEPQSFRPFFALADSVNGIQASYPDPAQGWEYDTAPAYYRTDLEGKDGNRRLMASPSFDAVPYPAQVQRLQKSAIEEAQRARGHTVVLPPWYWTVEPGDVGEWTSPRNGYVDKEFRVDVGVDKLNGDMGLSLTEVDPADYDWDHGTEFKPVTTGPTIISRPAPQGVVDWVVEPWTLPDSGGIGRRPALRFTWDATLPGIVGIKFEVRLAEDESAVTDGTSPPEPAGVGAIIVSQSLLPDEDYEARIQYSPSSPRDMLWTNWRGVTTPDVRDGLIDFDDGIRDRVTAAIDQLYELETRLDQARSAVARISLAIPWNDKGELKRELMSVSGVASARITEVFTVATNTQAALAQTDLAITAGLAEANSRIDITNTSLSDLTQSVADQTEAFNSQFGDISGQIVLETQTRSDADGALSIRISDFTAQTNQSFASVNSQILAQADQTHSLAGQLSSFNTTLNGHTSRLDVLSASVDGVSFEFGITGTLDSGSGAFILSGARRNDGGISTNILMRADQVIIDGSVKTPQLDAGAVTAIKIKAGELTSDSGVFGRFAVKSFTLAGNAVTVPKFGQQVNVINGNGGFRDVVILNVPVNTNGLAGEKLTVEAQVFFKPNWPSGATNAIAGALLINNSVVQQWSTDGSNTIPYGVLLMAKDVIATGGDMVIPVVLQFSAPLAQITCTDGAVVATVCVR